jgi:hypothetical protein
MMERSRNDKSMTGDGPDAAVADKPLPAASRDWALFLDIDGTLLEIAATPEQVRVSARLREVLAELQLILGGALALVSGRSVAAVDRLFGVPNLAVAGLHGLEWRCGSGEIRRIAGLPPVEALRRPLAELAAEPTRYSPNVLLRPVLESAVLPTVGYVESVAAYIGVHRSQIRRWLKRGRIEEVITLARAVGID